jgi:ABC-type Fe3+-hydroxamate transport system, periplasmic component
MTAHRIVSLAPSATAILTAIGVGGSIVGATAHCDTDAPTIGGWLTPDRDRLAAADPTVIFTADALQADLAADLSADGYRVCHVEPTTLDEVFASFRTVGAAVDRAAAAEALIGVDRARVAAVRTAVAGRERPVVYAEEWGRPPMAAGNWVPEAIAAAGGRYPFVAPGDRSARVDGETVEAAAPDLVVLHHCGAGERTDPAVFTDRPWGVDAPVEVIHDDLLNQPSPRLIDGIVALAQLCHPEVTMAAPIA